MCALALLALPGLAWRQTRAEAKKADEHGYVFTKGGRRLASTQIENVALLGNKKKFSRLAALAEFSTQLLLREGSSRVRILELNREIKRETYNRHYDTELYRQKLKLPVRSEPELARFVNESYDAISSPDLHSDTDLAERAAAVGCIGARRRRAQAAGLPSGGSRQ